MAFKFLRVDFGSLPAYLTACRYAIKPMVYSLFEHDHASQGRMSAGRVPDFDPWLRRRRVFLREIMLPGNGRLRNLTTARPILN